MADRIELMRVALSAPDRQPQPNNAGRVDAVDDFLDTKLFGIRSAFLVDQRVTMKAGGNELLPRWVGKQITRELFDRELIKWFVFIQRLNHPIAVRPHRALGVDGV